jgi:phosphoglycolate phosphatase-like HAD superfamily hydrolase
MKLILFDIDGTLVLSGRAGARAMAQTFKEVLGVASGFETVPMAGRTDAWIIAQVAALGGMSCDDRLVERVHDTYVGHLMREIHQPGPQKGVLPGVRTLLDALSLRADTFLGLLTGNFETGARIKLEYFDLWRYFRCGAFGDAAHDRNGLLPTAVARAQAGGWSPPDPSQVVIVGDTPLDVAVARAGAVRSVAVATGSYDADALHASGADVVLEDLGDLRAAVRALGL